MGIFLTTKLQINLLILRIRVIPLQYSHSLKQQHVVQSNLYQIENEIPWEDLGNGIQRQVYGYDDKVMLVKVKFEKDAIGQLHHHPHTQVTYVESGIFEMTIGDVTKSIQTGDGFYVPPHAVHGIVCIQPGMLVDVFAPLREDFLQT